MQSLEKKIEKKKKKPTTSLHKGSFSFGPGLVGPIHGHFTPGVCKHIFHPEDVEALASSKAGREQKTGYLPGTSPVVQWLGICLAM